MLKNLEAAVATHIAYDYNFCWQMRENGNKGGKRPTQAMQAGISDRLWTFGELFETAVNRTMKTKRAPR